MMRSCPQTKRNRVSLSTAKSVGPTTVVQTEAVADPVVFRKGAGRQFCRGQQGSDFLGEEGGRRGEFEGLYYRSLSDCIRLEAVMGIDAGGVAPPA